MASLEHEQGQLVSGPTHAVRQVPPLLLTVASLRSISHVFSVITVIIPFSITESLYC